jgi:hypothetical protein
MRFVNLGHSMPQNFQRHQLKIKGSLTAYSIRHVRAFQLYFITRRDDCGATGSMEAAGRFLSTLI